MEKYIVTNFYSGWKKSSFLLAAGLIFTFLSCDEAESEISPDRAGQNDPNLTAQSASSNTSITEISFTATAAIGYCYGENIAFSGIIENRVTKTTDAGGTVHYNRSFNTRGLTGVGVISGTVFDVLGGAEMFAIKDAVLINGVLHLGASLAEADIVIHEGTLVFQSRTDQSKIIARHIIRKVPGQETIINKWECRGV